MNRVGCITLLSFLNGALAFSLTSCASGPELSATSLSAKQAGQVSGSLSRVDSAATEVVDPDGKVTVEDCAAIAKKADLVFEDGWIAGRDPRIFKSPYRTISARAKGEFAVAYHDFLEPFHQDLANDRSTYVPYRVRATWAKKYWANSEFGEQFKKEAEKYQIAWAHESLLDGSELWWKAAEQRFGKRIDSVLALVHDTEQNMVSKYMEDEKTESTFSAQMSDKSKKKVN